MQASPPFPAGESSPPITQNSPGIEQDPSKSIMGNNCQFEMTVTQSLVRENRYKEMYVQRSKRFYCTHETSVNFPKVLSFNITFKNMYHTYSWAYM